MFPPRKTDPVASDNGQSFIQKLVKPKLKKIGIKIILLDKNKPNVSISVINVHIVIIGSTKI